MLFPYAMCFFLAGMGLSGVSELPITHLCALIAAGIVAAFFLRGRKTASVVLAAVFLPLGALMVQTSATGLPAGMNSEELSARYGTDTPLRIYGDVALERLSVHYKDAIVINARVIESRGKFENTNARILVFVRDEMPEFQRGDEVAFDCVFGDFSKYLRSGQVSKYGVDAWCWAQGAGLASGPPSSASVKGFLGFRNALLNHLEYGLSDEYAALYQGIVFGRETQRLTPSFYEDFYAAGMSHLIVASGAQVALIIFPFFTLYGRFRSRWLKAALLILMGVSMILLYLIVGHASSILRAVSVGFILLIGRALGRSTYALNSLSIAGLMWLIIDPKLIGHLGFLLSYFASFGILYMAPIIVGWVESRFPEALRGWGPRTPPHLRVYYWLKRNVIHLGTISIASQWGVMPIIAWKLGELYFNGIAANIIAVPLGSVVLIIGAASGVAGFIHPALSSGLNYIALPFLHLIIGTANFFGGMEFLRISAFRPPLVALVAYYVGTIALIEILRKNTVILHMAARLRRGDIDLLEED